ncbi:MAG: hypothetical protein DWQ01_01970 [Planctomycetota bacterium]|nr:MAG: hypothetical protein DWQ01_01970 [Planctomycetota bacterium]
MNGKLRLRIEFGIEPDTVPQSKLDEYSSEALSKALTNNPAVKSAVEALFQSSDWLDFPVTSTDPDDLRELVVGKVMLWRDLVLPHNSELDLDVDGGPNRRVRYVWRDGKKITIVSYPVTYTPDDGSKRKNFTFDWSYCPPGSPLCLIVDAQVMVNLELEDTADGGNA